jgi:hypothetical protein
MDMNKKTQVLCIHGGMTFKNRKDYLYFLKNRKISIDKKADWTGNYLDEKLGRNFHIIRPRMPLQDNAKYEDWKIHFEKYLPYLKGKSILLGSSLGGIFLAKYLSENKLPKKVLSTYLICPPFSNDLIDEDLVGGFNLSKNLSKINENTKNLYLMFSKDDDCVPVSHAEKFRKKLPNAKIIIYKSKNGHFNISTFSEIVKMIKSDVNKK